MVNKLVRSITARTSAAILGGLLLLPLAQADEAEAVNQPEKESIWSRDKLTGDWDGLRSDMERHGLEIDMKLSQFYQEVTSGGVDSSNGGEYGVLLDTWFNVDMNKLFGTWEGLHLTAHVQSRDGSDVSADAGGLLLSNAALLYPLPGDYDGTNVTTFFFTQMLFDDQAALLAGKLGSFDVLEGLFPQGVVSHGTEGFMNANSIMSIYSWGRWLTLSQYGVAGWTYADGMPSTGFIVAGTENTTTTWYISDSFSDGVGIMLFHRFVYNREKLGYVYVGAGGSTKEYASTDPVDWAINPGGPGGYQLESLKEKKPWDVAVYVYQVLWQEQSDKPSGTTRRVQLFTGGSVGDDNPSFADWDVFANLQAFGVFDSRPNDRMGIAAHYYHMADDIVDLGDEAGVNLRDNSWTTELYYNYEINPWLHLSPNVQYGQNENGDDDPAVIVGARLVIDF
jgi:porin